MNLICTRDEFVLRDVLDRAPAGASLLHSISCLRGVRHDPKSGIQSYINILVKLCNLYIINYVYTFPNLVNTGIAGI